MNSKKKSLWDRSLGTSKRQQGIETPKRPNRFSGAHKMYYRTLYGLNHGPRRKRMSVGNFRKFLRKIFDTATGFGKQGIR